MSLWQRPKVQEVLPGERIRFIYVYLKSLVVLYLHDSTKGAHSFKIEGYKKYILMRE